MSKIVDYVLDLGEVRTEFEKMPPEVRRPEVVMADEYHDSEVFDMEVQTILPYLEDKRFAGEMLSRYTQDIIANFEQGLEEHPEELLSSIHIAVQYARGITQLGEKLWEFFKENQLYDEREKLIGQYQQLAQGRWLVIRREQPVQK